jgi:hypothetical protein
MMRRPLLAWHLLGLAVLLLWCGAFLAVVSTLMNAAGW